MSRNNDVFKVLFLPNAIAEAYDQVERATGLSNGEWGVFDYDTGLNAWPLVGSAFVAADIPSNFYIAYMGDGTLGTAGKLYTSTGTHIQKKNIEGFTINNDNVATNQVVTISGLECQSGSTATNYDYGIKFDFRGNTEIYQRFGANQASKFAVANTKCVGTGTASDDADAEVVAQWAESLANDTDQFISMSISGTGITNTPVVFTASGIAGTAGAWADAGGAITEAVALAEIRAYATTSTDLAMAITVGQFSSTYTFLNVNAKYFKQRGIHAVTSLIADDCTFGTITATTPMVYEEGLGYDVQELEYLAEGFTGMPGPYRQSRLNGLPFQNTEFIAVKATKYTICSLEYSQFSRGGWQDYLNPQSTYIILQATPTNTAGYPLHMISLIVNAVGAPVITT